MPVRNYSVLKGKPTAGRVFPPLNPEKDQPHYHIHIKNPDEEFDIAVNILSEDSSEVLFFIKDGPALDSGKLEALSAGLTSIHLNEGPALDYVKDHLVTEREMTDLPPSDTTDTPLSQRIDALLQAAIADANGLVYAWGSVFGGRGDNPFWHFSPDSGIHDIHMNQGNPPGHHDADNGADQDGGLTIFANGAYKSVFIAFKTQSFTTDEDGNVEGEPKPVPHPQGSHGQKRHRRRHQD